MVFCIPVEYTLIVFIEYACPGRDMEIEGSWGLVGYAPPNFQKDSILLLTYLKHYGILCNIKGGNLQ